MASVLFNSQWGELSNLIVDISFSFKKKRKNQFTLLNGSKKLLDTYFMNVYNKLSNFEY